MSDTWKSYDSNMQAIIDDLHRSAKLDMRKWRWQNIPKHEPKIAMQEYQDEFMKACEVMQGAIALAVRNLNN